jgi:hypothetical protein
VDGAARKCAVIRSASERQTFFAQRAALNSGRSTISATTISELTIDKLRNNGRARAILVQSLQWFYFPEQFSSIDEVLARFEKNAMQ